MGEIRHRRQGKVIDEPRNWQELEIIKEFTNGLEDVKVNIARLEFAGEEGIRIRDRIMNGNLGGVGAFEGDPYSIEYGQIDGDTRVFEGYLDYTDDPEFIGCNGVAISLKTRQGGDWLNDVADAFSFRYLYDVGVIKRSDFVKVPYVINYIPDTMQLIVLSMSLFTLTRELINVVRLLAEALGDTADSSTPVLGVSVGLGAGVVTAWDLGNIILTAVKFVAYTVYTIALIKAIKELVEQLVEQLMPPIREHKGISILTLFKAGCKNLGLDFKSDLINDRKDWVLIPQKGHKGGEKPTNASSDWKELGVPRAEDPVNTFGDLIRVFKEALNADFRIKNGVFRFERRDYWDDRGTYIIPDFFTDQKELRDVYTLNTSELVSNYAIYWAYDTQDQNTLDNQNGRVFQAITEPKKVENKDLKLMKGVKEVNIPFSLGVRKENLTSVEKLFKKVAKLIDKLTGILGGGTNYVSKIDRRKGVLMMSSHFLTIPKIVVMKGGKLSKGQREKLSSRKLWDELHFINSFVENKGHHNQYKLIQGQKIPFCYNSLLSLLDNANCVTKDGDNAFIESLRWKVWEDTAVINYRVKYKYTENLKIKIVE